MYLYYEQQSQRKIFNQHFKYKIYIVSSLLTKIYSRTTPFPYYLHSWFQSVTRPHGCCLQDVNNQLGVGLHVKDKTIHFLFRSQSLGTEHRTEGYSLGLGKTLSLPPPPLMFNYNCQFIWNIAIPVLLKHSQLTNSILQDISRCLASLTLTSVNG